MLRALCPQLRNIEGPRAVSHLPRTTCRVGRGWESRAAQGGRSGKTARKLFLCPFQPLEDRKEHWEVKPAVEFLRLQLALKRSPLIELAVEYDRQFETGAQITASYRTLAQRLFDAYGGRS